MILAALDTQCLEKYREKGEENDKRCHWEGRVEAAAALDSRCPPEPWWDRRNPIVLAPGDTPTPLPNTCLWSATALSSLKGEGPSSPACQRETSLHTPLPPSPIEIICSDWTVDLYWISIFHFNSSEVEWTSFLYLDIRKLRIKYWCTECHRENMWMLKKIILLTKLFKTGITFFQKCIRDMNISVI